MRETNGNRPETIPQAISRGPQLTLGVVGLALAALLQTQSAEAAEFGDENTRISIDTTLSHGLSWRVSDRDETLIGVNSDDGDRNYDKGLISNTSKFNTEIEVDNGEIGLFARLQGFIDFENRNGRRERTPLSKEAKGEVGDGLEILDLYATTSFEAGDSYVDLRLGNQVLNWGESTFIQNGINVINPFDVSKLRKPGAELRDGLLPVPMVSMSADITPNLSIEGFYQAAWKETRVDPAGTYFSTNDYGSPGGDLAYIDLASEGVVVRDHGMGAPLINPAIPSINSALNSEGLTVDQETLLSVRRASDKEPKDTGQWGVALRYYAEELNDTEFGLYYVTYHSRLPLAVARFGTLEGYSNAVTAARTLTGIPQLSALALPIALDQYGRTVNYAITYPEDLEVFGLSFNTALGTSGWALQGEYSFHPDQPLQRHEDDIFEEGLAPVICTLAPAREGCPSLEPAQISVFWSAVLGKPLQGYIERDVSQLQATATRVFGPVLGADSLLFVVEGAWMHVHGLPDRKAQPLDTPGSGEAATKNSYGYRLASKLDYTNAIGPATLSPYLQFQHDVNGYSPSPAGPFEEGRTALTLGIGVNYLERWRGDLSFTNFNGDTNALSDRDFVSLSMSYSF